MYPLYFHCQHSCYIELFTLSLHDALPISTGPVTDMSPLRAWMPRSYPGSARIGPVCPKPVIEHATSRGCRASNSFGDRKSTRLNSSHLVISYAVFCLKKK